MRKGITDKALEGLIKDGIRLKPASYSALALEKGGDTLMSSIGG